MRASIIAIFTLAPLAVLSHGLRPVKRLFVDFDGTIATNDAFDVLAYAAYNSYPNGFNPPWSYFVDVYYAEYEAFSESFGPRPNLESEIAYRTSPALRKVEADSFDRVAASGLFSGAKAQEIKRAAKNVTIRAGWWDLVSLSLDNGIRPEIVSLNWSPSWIREVLRQNAKGKQLALAEKVVIYCSEVLPRALLKPNPLDKPTRLHTGGDKVDLIRKLIGKSKEPFAFIGDSTNDLPPLLQASVGIIAGADDSFNRTLVRLGIPVQEGLRGVKYDSGTNDTLYRIYDFKEVVKSGLVGR